MSEKQIRQFIRESINRNRKRKTITLSTGKKVQEGSKQHLVELDRTIFELDSIRKQLGREFRKERYTISRCIESIRFMRRKLKREGLRSGLLSEND
tara:strand:+ start:2201 stop:2488 length:288 start_codon:yes stop_codon:yes gene_type:complete